MRYKTIVILLLLIVLGSMYFLLKKDRKAIIQEEVTKKEPGIEKIDPGDEFIYNEHDPVSAGSMYYYAWVSVFSDTLDENTEIGPKPNAKFLIIKLSVENQSHRPETIPAIKLVDQDGSEYVPYTSEWKLRGLLTQDEILNPGVKKIGFIVFDVPPNRQYYLVLHDNNTLKTHALIRLSPLVYSKGGAP